MYIIRKPDGGLDISFADTARPNTVAAVEVPEEERDILWNARAVQDALESWIHESCIGDIKGRTTSMKILRVALEL